MEKGGQEHLSFGMIFSIILIVVFVAFAVYAITKFLSIGEIAQIAKFAEQMESDIDKIWKGSQGSRTAEYFLPSKIEYVCFADYNSNKKGANQGFYDELNLVYSSGENLFFYPVGSSEGLTSKEVKHIDIEKITEKENPYCIKNTDGKIKITLKKDFSEALVTITR